MKRRPAALALAIGLALGQPAAAREGLIATLTSGKESVTTGSGSRGTGAMAFVSVDGRQIVLSIAVRGLDGPPTGIHLHRGDTGVHGPALITFFGPPSDQLRWFWSSSHAMEDTVPAELALDLVAHPERYTLDVHTGDSGVPAIRGTLSQTPARTPEEAGIRYQALAPGAIGAIDLPPGPRAAAPGTAIGLPVFAGRPAASRGSESPRDTASAPRPGTPWRIGAPVHDAPEEPVSAEPPPSGPRSEQMIRFGRLPRLVYGDPDAPLQARATSGLPVSFTATGDCSVTGASLHVVSAGRCWLTAHQYGNATWSPAEAEARLQIEKAGQSISMRSLYPMTYLDPDPDLGATATSGLPVVVLAYGDCEVRYRSTLHILGAGSCTISAHQPGDSNFTAASILDGSFTIARADQSIDYAPIPDQTSRGTYPLQATATSGLTVFINAIGPCSVLGSALEVQGSGSCTVWYAQDGDRNFNPAPAVSQTFQITLPE